MGEPAVAVNAVNVAATAETVPKATVETAPLNAQKADSAVVNAVPIVATGVLAAPVEPLHHVVDRLSVLLLKSTTRRTSLHWVRHERLLRRLLSFSRTLQKTHTRSSSQPPHPPGR